MEIHTAEAGGVGNGGADLLAEGDDDHDIGRGQAFSVDVGGAEQGQILRQGVLGDGGGGELSATAGGSVGLRDDSGKLVTGGAQGHERQQAELAATGKEDACCHLGVPKSQKERAKLEV